MLLPKRVKYRKAQRGRMKGVSKGNTTVHFGEFGLKAMQCGWITANQIEACRVTLVKFIKKGGKIWVRIFPDKPVSKKPAETRMGKGKGAPEFWVSVVKPGRVMFEIGGIDEINAREAIRLIRHKLPIKTRFVTRNLI